MVSKEYLIRLFSKILKNKNKIKLDNNLQQIYNNYGYGYSDFQDAQLLMYLQQYNMELDKPYLATGQNGYFSEQIESNGLGNFKLNEQDIEDARFISRCFGIETNYSDNTIPITYVCVLGNVEFNYASQTFPAGIFEDVFQCSPTHELPIQPLVGESEIEFYLRLLEYQISISPKFDVNKKVEVLLRAKRLISNFCKNNNRVYLVSIEDVLDIKAYFGDVEGLRDGTLSKEKALEKISSLTSLEELLKTLSINMDSIDICNNPNMTSEYGISLYGIIPPKNLKYIEVARKYQLIQKRAIDEGYIVGDVIPKSFGEIEHSSNKIL